MRRLIPAVFLALTLVVTQCEPAVAAEKNPVNVVTEALGQCGVPLPKIDLNLDLTKTNLCHLRATINATLNVTIEASLKVGAQVLGVGVDLAGRTLAELAKLLTAGVNTLLAATAKLGPVVVSLAVGLVVTLPAWAVTGVLRFLCVVP